MADKNIVSMTPDETAAWLRGDDNWLSYVTDPDLRAKIIEQNRLLREAMIESAETFAKALDNHSSGSARVVRKYAAKAQDGDVRAAEQMWNYITQMLSNAHVEMQ